MRSPLPLAAALLVLAAAPSVPAFAGPSTVWLNVPAGAFPVNTPVTLSTGGGTSAQVTVATGGSQGVGGGDLDTLGAAATALQYTDLYVVGIFNGGGSGTVPTSLTFSNIHTGVAHERGLLMVGAINGASSPVTVSSSVPGRVATWAVVGQPFAYGPQNSYPVTWDAASGTINTTASSGNDSRCIVLDVGDLGSDGVITISLSQNLNDGIIYALGEELLGPLDVPGTPAAAELALAAPRPNPVRDATELEFVTPAAGPARVEVYDVGGRRLAVLAAGTFAAGAHAVHWSLPSGAGRPAPGVCFVRLETPAGTRLRRIVIAR